MTDDDNSILPFDSLEESRRSMMKKSALAAAGTGVAASGAGAAAAQEGDDDVENGMKALMFTNQVRARSEFVITSPVLEWIPNVAAVRDNIWSEYNTRMIRYLGTGERAIFFQAHDAQVPNFNQEAGYVVDSEGDTADDGTPQPEVFNLDPDPALFGDTPELMTIQFSAAGEDQEDDLLDDEDWWLGGEEENGTATGTDSV